MSSPIWTVCRKELLETAHVHRTVREAAQFGIRAGEPTIDFTTSQARKQQIVDGLWKGLEGLIKGRKIAIFNGTGRFAGNGRVEVAGADPVIDAYRRKLSMALF